MKELTEKQIRAIAREEALLVQKEVLTELNELKKTLERLERLLLGELGTDQEDTLKARANFAYQHAKRDSDLKITERTIPVLEWFEDWDKPEKGEKESRFSRLGRMMSIFGKIEWLFAILGVTTVTNLFLIIKAILDFLG